MRLALLALALAAPVAAGDFRIVVRGTVTQVLGTAPAPFQAAAPGTPMVLTLEVYDSPTAVVPGVSNRYPLEDPRSVFELGGVALPLFPGFVPGSVTLDDGLLPPNLPSPFDALSLNCAADGGPQHGVLPIVTSLNDPSAQALPSNDGAALAQMRYSVAWPSSIPAGDLVLFQRRILVERVEFVPDSIGHDYCPATVANTAGEFARIELFGQRAAAANDATLVARGLPAGSPGYFLVSRTADLMPLPTLSAGTLCLGGAIGRFVGPGQLYAAAPDGTASLTLDLGALATPTGFVAAAPGETWRFQSWYRQPAPVPASSHFTGATAVTLE